MQQKYCKQCNKMFWTYYAKFCSHQCYAQSIIGRKLSIKTKQKMSNSRSGEKHYHWKGGKIKNWAGYIETYQPNHPFCSKRKYVKEHRLVMEKYLKRFLKPTEVVHHKNGNITDNRIKNLKLCSKSSEHNKFHLIPRNKLGQFTTF